MAERAAMQEWLTQAAAQRSRSGTVRTTDPRRHPRADDGLLDLASNDYLGLAGDQRLRLAAAAATRKFGTGAGASRVVTGTTDSHAEAEHELAVLTGQQSCLVFSSGYTANIGLLTALGDPGTLLVSDAHVHASLIDGARLARSPVKICPHRDLDALDRLLRNRAQPRAIVVIESVYSVLGDAADLTRTAAICAQRDALLIVDEAHGIGVTGAGRGAVYAAGLAGTEHVVITATLSKALGTQGGAVLGPTLLREHLVSVARTALFDTALAPAAAAAAAAACRIIAAEPQRVAALHQVADQIAAAAGIDRAPGAVQSIPVASPDAALATAQQLYDQGVLVGCFRPPSVPDGISRLRLTARATVDASQAARAAGLALRYTSAREPTAHARPR
jgi:8-amino-7-oxononanoate synthase